MRWSTTVVVSFYSNQKEWMVSTVFSECLKSFNIKMRGQRVFLLLNNAPSHINIELSKIYLHFLSPNTTSHLQPMDEGVILNCKLHYGCGFL